MSEIVIRAEGLSKRYHVARQPYHALRDVLERAIRGSWRRTARETDPADRLVWALRDVSFEVEAGSVVGIVGANGGGKTTLLKILSRITSPTHGRALVRGRVGSLLEVGTGFHPELSGRENVFLSGAILGMREREIAARFDAIVAFSGIEQFIDGTLKHYSTGMQLRLAFAVAAHLEPEVLFVDEVLAVGDLEFQRKCLGKMEEVSRGGRTILLVSHQMSQIRRLCGRTMWLDAGRVRAIGPTAEVVSAYERTPPPNDVLSGDAGRKDVEFLGWDLHENGGATGHVLRSRGPVAFVVRVRVRKAIEQGQYGITLYDQERRPVWSTLIEGLRLEPGEYNIVHRLTDLPLKPGLYAWQPGLFDGHEWSIWWARPDFVIDTAFETYHRLDEHVGWLNIPAAVDFSPSR